MPIYCDQAVVTIDIYPNPFGDNFTFAVDDSFVGSQNTPITGDLLANDYDPEGDVQTINTTPVVNPANGTVTINTDGTFTYIPNPGYYGPDQFVYQVCDNGTPEACDVATVYLLVYPVNNPPVAIDDVNNTLINTPVSGQVLTNDFDPDGNLDPTSVTLVDGGSATANGTLTLNDDGTYLYEPGLDFTGTVSFTYQVCDTGVPVLCDQAVVTITVIPVPDPLANNPPVAVNDAYEGLINTPVLGTVITNDWDPDGNLDPLSVTLVNGGSADANGTLTLNNDGTFTFTPDNNFVGQVSFTYQVCDTDNLCDQAVVTIDIYPNPFGDNFTFAVDDSFVGSQNTPITGDLLANDYDPEGDVQTINTTPVVNPANGTVTINTDGTFTYIPNPGYYGPDQFVYQVCDNGTPEACDVATVYLLVYPVNNPPVAIDDVNNTLINTPVSGQVLTNDFDPDGNLDPTSVTLVDGGSAAFNGTLTLNDDGTYLYEPGLDFTGTVSFTYQVCDTGVPVLCDQAIVTITVIPVPDPLANNPPVAVNDAYEGLINTPVLGTVITNDWDPDGNLDPLSVTLVNGGSAVVNGTLVLTASGTFTFTPDNNFVGQVSFTYQVCDTGMPIYCDQAVVTIDIYPNPFGDNFTFAVDDSFVGSQNTPITGDLLANDYDPEGDVQTINTTPVVNPANGTVTINTDGTFTYIPNPGYYGPDQFVYQVCDNGTPEACDVATVYLLVYPVNNPPVAIDDVNNTLINTPVSGQVLTNDFDPDGNLDPTSVTLVDGGSATANGTLTLNDDGTYLYEPGLDFTGTVSFTYQVCDTGVPVLCDQAVVTITVIPVPDPLANNPPVAVNDAYEGLINTPVLGTVITNDWDPDGNLDPLSVTLVNGGSAVVNGTLVLTASGTFTFTPDNNFVGQVSFTYSVCDDGMPIYCDQAVVTIDIYPNPFGDNFTFAVDDSFVGSQNTPITGDLLANDYDPEGDVQTINTTPVVNPANGTVTINTDGTFTYIPNPGYYGPDQFVYQVCDNGTPEACDVATVYLLVYPVNNPPVAIDDVNNTLINTPVSGQVLTNDFDPDGNLDPTSVTLVDGGSAAFNGTLTLNDDGTYLYEPGLDFTGTVSFTYQVCDTGVPVLCDQAVVTITVIPVPDPLANNPPVAVNDAYEGLINTPVLGTVITNDWDPDGNLDPLSVTLVNGGSAVVNGTLVLTASGTFTFTPDNNFVGQVSFTYQVCDDGMPIYCDQAVVTIDIYPNPFGDNFTFAVDDSFVGSQNTPITGDLLANDYDPEGDVQTINTTPVVNPANGTVTINTDGTFTYIPNPGYYGPDQFVYQVCDNGTPEACDVATVYLLVTINYPIAVDDLYVTPFNTSITDGDVTGNDSYPAGSVFAVVQGPDSGDLIFSTDGSFTFTPALDFMGIVTFSYSVCLPDPYGFLCDQAIVTIIVTYYPDDVIEHVDCTLEAGEPIPPVISDAEGNLVSYSSMSVADIPNPIICSGSRVYTYNYTNSAGNSIFEWNYTYEVVRNTIPSIVTPVLSYKVVNCLSEAVWPTEFPVVQTVCGQVINYTPPVNVTTGGYSGGTFCNGGFRRYTFKYKDPCDPSLVLSWVFMYHIAPSQPPVLAGTDDCSIFNQSGIPQTIAQHTSTFNPASLEAGIALLYKDVCNGIVTALHTGTIADPANDDSNWKFTYEYTIANTCGKFVTCQVVYEGGFVILPIYAGNDNFSDVVGAIGNPDIGNVLVNDQLGGQPANLSTVEISVLTEATPINGGPIPVLNPATGIVSVPAGTPAGNYFITYSICEIVYPANCAQAIVTVTVIASQILADNDDYTSIPVYSSTGNSNLGNVLDNDELNGNTPLTTQVSIEVLLPSTDPGVQLNTATGQVSVAAGTAPGHYTIHYQICEILNPGNCDDAYVTVFVMQPSIAVTKTADPATYNAIGDIISYTIVVENTGNVALSNVVVNDPLIPAITDQNIGQLNPGGTHQLMGTYTITLADMNSGSVVNTATVSGKDPNNGDVIGSSSATVTANQQPSIAVTKSASPDTYVAEGDIITYTIQVTNNGNVSLTNVIIDDPLIPAISNQNIGQLNPGGTHQLMGTYTITLADMNSGSVVNTATASGKDPNNGDVIGSSSATVTANQQPSIAVTKSASPDTYVAEGDIITYTIQVTNNGNVSLTNVIIDDPLIPAISNQNIGTLTPGSTQQLVGTYTITLTNMNSGSVVNTATVSGKDPNNGDVIGSSSATVTANQQPSIAVAKSASPETYVAEGDIITYTIQVTNNGNVSLTNVIIDDPLIPAISNQNIGTLTPGGTHQLMGTYTITLADMNSGSVVNTATVSGKDPNNGDVIGSSSATVTANQQPSIAVTKSASPETYVAEGDIITYTIQVTNTGNVSLSNVVVDDPLIPAISNQNIGTLTPGSTQQLVGSYTVTLADINSGSVVNTATASGKDPNNGDVIGSSSATVTANQQPSIAVAKSASPDTYVAEGDIITYTIQVTNTGNVSLSNVVVDDPLIPAISNLNIGLLTPGSTQQLVGTYTITLADMNSGSVVNTATANGTDPKGGNVNDTDSAIALYRPANGAANVNCLTEAVEPTPPMLIDEDSNMLNVSLTGFTDTPTVITCNGIRVYEFEYKNSNHEVVFEWSFTYTIQRITPPHVYVDPNVPVVPTRDTVDCLSQAVWPVQLPVVHDACGNVLNYTPPVNVTTGGYSGGQFCNGGFRRYTFKYKDPCNPDLYLSWIFIYEIRPSQPPVLADQNAGCSSLDQYGVNQTLVVADAFDPKSLESQVAALYVDQCNAIVTALWTGTQTGQNNNDDSWTFTYNFKIQNACGEFVTCSVVYQGGVVPEHIVLNDRTISDGEIVCFGASETIIVSDFTVEDGGSATFIAGESVRFLPGTVVQPGGYMHAYISNVFCVNPTPLVIDKDADNVVAELITDSLAGEMFVVYPNPSNGLFNIETSGFDNNITVEVYDVLGNQLWKQSVSGQSRFHVDLLSQPTGIYIIRIYDSEKSGFRRVVKQ
jgi:large repetitive protein